VSDSVQFLRESSDALLGVVEKLRAVNASVLRGQPNVAAAEDADRAQEDADLPYVLENLPRSFDRVSEGLGRVTTIVRSLKDFAHPGTREMKGADLNHAIETTLTLARNEYKYVADLETDLAPLLPPIVCHVGDVNQMVLNIVLNAAQAIGEVVKGTDQRGKIRVSTRQEGQEAVICISDTGGGIPAEIRGKVFDPFFTTKDVGKGSGQGLAIARAAVKKHKGHIRFQTEAGKGTTFTVRLPIAGAAAPEPGDREAA
jgi:two-component system, NtrC family, sensor kinase